MRKISHRPRDYNLRRPGTALLCAVLLLGGCRSDLPRSTAEQSSASAADCPVTIDATAWTAFEDLSARLAAGREVTGKDLESFAELPVVTAWRRSLQPHEPEPATVARWLRAAWPAPTAGPHLKRPRKLGADGRNMRRYYRYSREKAADIDRLIESYRSGPQLCKLADLVSYWIEPGRIPQPLRLNFIPALAEVRLLDDQVFVDTGVLAAGGTTQTNHSIAALLYRNLELAPRTDPLAADGEQALAGCLRTVLDEGVVGWIQQFTHTYFDQAHPSLGKLNVVPVDFYRNAQRTVARLNRALPGMFADPDSMATGGPELAHYLAASSSLNMTGIAMAETIVARFGEDRLRAVRHSVPEFLVAYQAATRPNPAPVPDPGAEGIELYESMPPLAPGVYEPLLALLKGHFQAGSEERP